MVVIGGSASINCNLKDLCPGFPILSGAPKGAFKDTHLYRFLVLLMPQLTGIRKGRVKQKDSEIVLSTAYWI